MKPKSYADYLSPFHIIASREGHEIARCRVDALGPEDAMASGVFMVPQVEMFDFTVDFRVEPVHA
jgi:hypothetical protein